jgi:hypothetical protein
LHWGSAIQLDGHSCTRSAGFWDEQLPDAEWVLHFLHAVGTDAAALPPEVAAALVALTPVVRRGRPAWQADLPLAELAAARFPKLVVSGGGSAGFEAICDDLAARIGASRRVIEGAGHEIQFTGPPINEALVTLWQRVPESDRLAGRLPA